MSAVQAAVAEGVARRVITKDCDSFTRSKPSGTTNYAVVGDEIFGSTVSTIELPRYKKSNLPSVNGNMLIYVQDDVDGPTVAFSDGAYWRRMADRNVIS